tara:strand:+ start:133 stop:333 length:201 start_codon:yes stop_codon:yes gene_type:complete
MAEKYIEDIRAELQAEIAGRQAALKALGDIEQLETKANLIAKVKANAGARIDTTDFKGNVRPLARE